MRPSAPYRMHLESGESLVTSYAATRAGFVALALERNVRATPAVEEARSLRARAQQAKTAYDLLDVIGIEAALLTAAGVSDKAARHLEPRDKDNAIVELISKFLEPAGEKFVEELVYRFLLTWGDTLGGAMRNIGGQLAQQKLTRCVIAALTLGGVSYEWLPMQSKVWIPKPNDNDTEVERHLRGLTWTSNGNVRTMIYNLTVPLVRNNVDMCLFDCASDQCEKIGAYSDLACYLALGELKGGIDPAGADEHWKTARTALERIRSAFASEGLSPATFFVGAAIASKMAEEIWMQLEGGTLTNAANLTDADQMAELCSWLISL